MLLPIRLYCTLLLIYTFSPLSAAPPGGLKFQGSERPINQRTSYDVFGNEAPEVAGQFSISFDLALYPTTEFGYILRLKNKDNDVIYNLFYDGQGDHLVFKFNEEGTYNLITATLEKSELPHMDWFRMKIAFDLLNDTIRFSINDRVFGANKSTMPDTYRPIILFGKSDHIIDVPSFAMKDLVVEANRTYHFPLQEIEGYVAHDTHGDGYGKIANAEWLMNDAYHWRYKASFKSKSVAGANYNPEQKEIYYFNKDSLHIYNVRSDETQVQVFDKPCPVDLVLGTNFIDTQNDKLYSYEVYYSTPYEGPTVASLDLNTYRWKAENYDQLPRQLHHHGSYVDPASKQFTLFGGFGNMRYSKDFFSYNIEEANWTTLEGFTGDVISPRYFCSVGYLKDNNAIYVFGGMGNESGEQIVGRKYYYDLYKVDLNKKHITKLWEINWNRDNVVPVRGMVILNDSCFYTLCYPEHFTQSYLKLHRFSLKDGSYEILGDSIPIYSDKITTNANLYYDNSLNNLYAVVQEFDDDIASDLKVYSLAFPPVTAQELASYARKEKKNTVAFVLVVIGLIGGGGYLFLRTRRRAPDDDPDTLPVPIVSIDKNEVPNKPEAPTRANSIYLFGEFTVRNKKNRDITYMFSAQLKQVFCLILQYSATEGGITSQRLSAILWPDRPADKAKNSRGVTINHLRKVLSELDGIELTYEKGHFKIAHTAPFYCDYLRCWEIISANETEEHRPELVEILSRGRFLQLSDHPLFDSFKQELESKLEPILLVELEKCYAAEQYEVTLALSDAIFNIDPFHEAALSYQIKAMQKLRMTDEAKVRYQTFVTEYKKIMGNEFPHAMKV